LVLNGAAAPLAKNVRTLTRGAAAITEGASRLSQYGFVWGRAGWRQGRLSCVEPVPPPYGLASPRSGGRTSKWKRIKEEVDVG